MRKAFLYNDSKIVRLNRNKRRIGIGGKNCKNCKRISGKGGARRVSVYKFWI